MADSNLKIWCMGSGEVIVDEVFAPGQEDFLEEELERLYGHRREIPVELAEGFQIISIEGLRRQSKQKESSQIYIITRQKSKKKTRSRRIKVRGRRALTI